MAKNTGFAAAYICPGAMCKGAPKAAGGAGSCWPLKKCAARPCSAAKGCTWGVMAEQVAAVVAREERAEGGRREAAKGEAAAHPPPSRPLPATAVAAAPLEASRRNCACPGCGLRSTRHLQGFTGAHGERSSHLTLARAQRSSGGVQWNVCASVLSGGTPCKFHVCACADVQPARLK